MITDLPVDIDRSFPNRSRGDSQHQKHHDVIHSALNDITAEIEEGRLSPAGINSAIESAVVGAGSVTPQFVTDSINTHVENPTPHPNAMSGRDFGAWLNAQITG